MRLNVKAKRWQKNGSLNHNGAGIRTCAVFPENTHDVMSVPPALFAHKAPPPSCKMTKNIASEHSQQGKRKKRTPGPKPLAWHDVNEECVIMSLVVPPWSFTQTAPPDCQKA